MLKLEECINQFIEQESLPKTYLDTALNWFTPLIEEISLHHNKAKRTVFIGVNGCQGSGKSTMSGLIQNILENVYEKSCLVLSLDDFYLKKSERQTLADDIHPLLSTRGVPGTHDTQLIASVLHSLKQGSPSLIPRFDKSIDDRSATTLHTKILEQIGVVIFEGWCWGVPSQANEQLSTPLNDLEKYSDQTGEWRNYVNRKLQNDYMPLYRYMDKWIFLKAPSFDSVYKWRCQQEHKLLQKVGNKAEIMSDREIAEFIQYYQRLTEHSLCTLEFISDWIFELDNERTITKSAHNAK
ncbi:hypothetical protein [Brumicola blandensis]|uniref:Kinase n=1 Tax=Brumicola blandensis TaxID=3075611 RepID=A0AAW8QWA2_9ALTE|nr:hypothetical protein [Alteromonas sp. W409]MDT0581381.1 hypothetical protein [Alteromonas sp. W409]